LPGEIFVTMAKQGSTISGLMDAFATVVSLALQHGVPLRVICQKLSHIRFEPSGWSVSERRPERIVQRSSTAYSANHG
jgi:ribonucleoside-diphosphate reductase alpha chain